MKRPIGISIALFCVLALLAATLGFMACGTAMETNTSGLATPSPSASPQVDCSAGHDAILKTIYAELAKSKYAGQVWQFNITESNKTVTITGWSAQNQEITNLVKYVAQGCIIEPANFSSAYCNMNANFQLIRSCAPGYFPCGDVCIPIGEYCIITATDGSGTSPNPYNCNTGISKTNTNTNSNTNSNGNTGTTKPNTTY